MTYDIITQLFNALKSSHINLDNEGNSLGILTDCTLDEQLPN